MNHFKFIRKALLAGLLVLLSACDGDSRPFEEAVEVGQLDLAGLNVVPPANSLPTIYLNHGQTLQLGLEGVDSAGNTVALSASGRAWRSNNPAVFDVNENGLLTAISDGQAEAFVIVGGIGSSRLSVEVDDQPLIAIASIEGEDIVDRCVPENYRALGTFGSTGNETIRTLNSVVWNVDNRQLASVSSNPDASARLTAQNTGVVQLTATVPGGTAGVADINGARSVEVADTLTALAIGTAISTISEGSSQFLSATGSYTSDTTDSTVLRQLIVTGGVNWSVATGEAFVDVSDDVLTRGLVTGLEAGSGVVRAACGNIFDERVIIVEDDDTSEDSDELSFNTTGSSLSLSLSAGNSFNLRVSTGSDFDVAEEVTDEVTWARVLSSTVIPFDLETSGTDAGLITPLAVGTANVTASLDDETISITVNIVSQ